MKKLSGKTVENIKITFYVDNLKKKVLKVGSETKNIILQTLDLSLRFDIVAALRCGPG